jgi:predicted DNA-binding transcriptional regulator YafY
VQAFCRLRQAERTFVLSRIAWARPYAEPAARPMPEGTGG